MTGENIEIVGGVKRGVGTKKRERAAGFPPRPCVAQEGGADALVVFIATPVEGEDGEEKFPIGTAQPMHAVRGGLVGEFDGGPALRAVGGGVEQEDGAAVDGVVGGPLGSDRDLALAVAIEVASGDADVVLGREIFGHHEFLPLGSAIPDDLFGVGEEDVGLAIAIDVGDREAVADGDFCVDRLGANLEDGEFGGDGGGGEAEREEAAGGREFHRGRVGSSEITKRARHAKKQSPSLRMAVGVCANRRGHINPPTP